MSFFGRMPESREQEEPARLLFVHARISSFTRLRCMFAFLKQLISSIATADTRGNASAREKGERKGGAPYFRVSLELGPSIVALNGSPAEWLYDPALACDRALPHLCRPCKATHDTATWHRAVRFCLTRRLQPQHQGLRCQGGCEPDASNFVR